MFSENCCLVPVGIPSSGRGHWAGDVDRAKESLPNSFLNILSVADSKGLLLTVSSVIVLSVHVAKPREYGRKACSRETQSLEQIYAFQSTTLVRMLAQ